MNEYTLSIIDGEGNIVFDQTVSPDYVIACLKGALEKAWDANRSSGGGEPQAKKEKPQKGKRGGKKGERKCGKCGEPGHQARTCDADEEQPPQGKSLEDHIRPLFEKGESYEEICMTLPNIPSAAIMKVYKRLESEKK